MCVCFHSISGAKKKQKTAPVLIRKTAKQRLGLILSKKYCKLNEIGDIGVRNYIAQSSDFVTNVM